MGAYSLKQKQDSKKDRAIEEAQARLKILHDSNAGKFDALKANSWTADLVQKLVGIFLPMWEPATKGAAHRGHLEISTKNGSVKLNRDSLPYMLGLDQVPELQKASGQTIQRFLQIVGALYNTFGVAIEKASDAVIAQVGEGGCSPSGLLAKVRDPDGPAWGEPLRKAERAANTVRDKAVSDICSVLNLVGRRAAEYNVKGGVKVPKWLIPGLAVFMPAHLEPIGKAYIAAVERFSKLSEKDAVEAAEALAAQAEEGEVEEVPEGMVEVEAKV